MVETEAAEVRKSVATVLGGGRSAGIAADIPGAESVSAAKLLLLLGIIGCVVGLQLLH